MRKSWCESVLVIIGPITIGTPAITAPIADRKIECANKINHAPAAVCGGIVIDRANAIRNVRQERCNLKT
jgi:hypothetical protein